MWFNSIMLGILGSPLHAMMSGNIMALTFTGRKSGTSYTTPVNYVRETQADGIERFWTMRDRDRNWWRNMRGGAPVTLTIKRKRIPVMGHLIEEPVAVAEALTHYLDMTPNAARFIRVPMENGKLNVDSLKAAAQKQVLVYFTPAKPAIPSAQA